MYQWNSVRLYKKNTAFLYLKIYWLLIILLWKGYIWVFYKEKDETGHLLITIFFFLQNAFIVELYRGELMVGFKNQTIWRRQQTPFIS